MKKTSVSRGSVLIFALLFTVLTTLIGLSLIGMKKGHYSASQLAVRAEQAKMLAHAGVHDAVAKLQKDPFFPSGVGDAQTYFSYKESLTRGDTGEVLGYYHVTVEQAMRDEEGVVTIKSVGQTTFSGETSARHATYAELNIRPGSFGIMLWKEGRAPR
jgi:hypothetical protein